ncbi:hypothetical protein EON81_01905 [bacterium]|nr:MAG: hypothetical protein EON81_01905 [bacterium]
MTQERRSPLRLLLMGLALSGVGVAWMLLVPESRFKGVTPLAIAQGSLIFGGILAMMFALALEDGESRLEQEAAIRRMVRHLLLWGGSCALLSEINVSFAPFLSFFIAGALELPLRRIFAWLGK